LNGPVVSVLVITNMYPPHYLGGYELLCRDVMRRMSDRGDEVTVLTSTMRRPDVAAPDEPRHAAPGRVAVRRDLPWWWDDHVITKPPPLARLRQEVAVHRIARAALRELRPDVVSVWNMGAMSLGLLSDVARTGAPTVFTVCDDWLVYGPTVDAWIRMFGRTSLTKAVGRALGLVARLPGRAPTAPWPGAYLFMSEATRMTAKRRRGWEFAPSGLIGGGIEPEEFPISSAPVAVRPWRWRLLFVGRVEHRKGVEAAVRSLTELPPEATLDILGPPEPAYMPTLEAVIAECGLGDRVRFGQVPREALAARYREADVFLFPSEWEEPFGLVPIEAMACDTPVIASGTGGSAEFLVDGGNCLIAPPGDTEAIAAAVRRLAGDEDLRRRLVEGGRVTAAWGNVSDFAASVIAWHDFACGGFAGAAPPDRVPPRP
jgi:glycosyltransferase involved in cell wall biosynthesis